MAKFAPHTASSAAARAKAKVGKKNAVGMCAREVIVGIFEIPPPWKWGGNGKAWAVNYFKASQRVVRTSDPKQIPKGAMVFWDARPGATTAGGKAGHVAVGAGNGKCYSTDLPTEGRWGLINISLVEKEWGKKLLGYVVVDGMGFTLTDEPAELKPLDQYTSDDFGPGAVGPHVTLLGERLVVHLAALGIASPYAKGPGPRWGAADERAVQLFQLAQGWQGAAADGLPGPETLKRLVAEPTAVGPVVPLVDIPATTTVTVRTLQMNVAGYNAEKGMRTAVSRSRRIVKRVRALEPQVACFQELSNLKKSKMLPIFDSGLKGVLARAKGGSDGRHIYFGGPAGHRVQRVASGVIQVTAGHRFKNDDKQAAWLAYTVDGVLAMDVSFHLESDDGIDPKSGLTADALRPLQMLDFLDQTIALAKKHHVDLRNVMLCGDTNSKRAVRDAMAKRGWVSVAEVAKTAEHTDLQTHNHWRPTVKGPPIDYAFVPKGVVCVKWRQEPDEHLADHNLIVFTRELARP